MTTLTTKPKPDPVADAMQRLIEEFQRIRKTQESLLEAIAEIERILNERDGAEREERILHA